VNQREERVGFLACRTGATSPRHSEIGSGRGRNEKRRGREGAEELGRAANYQHWEKGVEESLKKERVTYWGRFCFLAASKAASLAFNAAIFAACSGVGVRGTEGARFEEGPVRRSCFGAGGAGL